MFWDILLYITKLLITGSLIVAVWLLIVFIGANYIWPPEK